MESQLASAKENPTMAPGKAPRPQPNQKPDKKKSGGCCGGGGCSLM